MASTRFGSGGRLFKHISYGCLPECFHTSSLKEQPTTTHSHSGQGDQHIGDNDDAYNSNGRGYPDVSVVGNNIISFNNASLHS